MSSGIFRHRWSPSLKRRPFIPSKPSGQFTLVAESGSFTLSGQDAGLLKASILTAEVGSFTFTGQDVGLNRGYYLASDVGSFTLSGQDAGLIKDSVISSEVGSFILTGQDVGLTKNSILAANVGSFTHTGQDVAFISGFGIVAEVGTFSFDGQDVTFTTTVVPVTGTPGGSGWVKWRKKRGKSEIQELFDDIEATLRKEIFGEPTERRVRRRRAKKPVITPVVETKLAELVELSHETESLRQRAETLTKALNLEKEYRRIKEIEEDDLEVLELV